MQEAKDPKPAGTAAGDRSTENKDSDATSSETLSDLEEKEQVSDTGSDDSTSSGPSPDGAFDEGRGGGDDAGPM
jgi:hypothetical protein